MITGPLTEDERTALQQTLEFLEKEEGKSHKSYFWSGWAGLKLRGLLKRDTDRWNQLLEMTHGDKSAATRAQRSTTESTDPNSELIGG